MFWAQGYRHNENTTQKKLTHGDKRRENVKNLVTSMQQLRQVNPMELRVPNATIALPFQIVLPESLPSSFLYCGEHLSWFSVEYWLEVKFLGLT